MEDRNVKHKIAYNRVMPRVYNKSHPSNKAINTKVTRHDTSARIGAKTSSSNISSGVCMELPLVLTDYKHEAPAVKQLKPNIPKYVAKPKKTLKSLDPSKSPLVAGRNRQEYDNSCKIRVRSSAPCVTSSENVGCSDAHFRQCYSSRSHTRLKELKDEIKAFQKTQKLMQLRSNLFKKCGVVLDDVGQVAEDKAVQVAETDNASGDNRWWVQLLEPLRRRPTPEILFAYSPCPGCCPLVANGIKAIAIIKERIDMIDRNMWENTCRNVNNIEIEYMKILNDEF